MGELIEMRDVKERLGGQRDTEKAQVDREVCQVQLFTGDIRPIVQVLIELFVTVM